MLPSAGLEQTDTSARRGPGVLVVLGLPADQGGVHVGRVRVGRITVKAL